MPSRAFGSPDTPDVAEATSAIPRASCPAASASFAQLSVTVFAHCTTSWATEHTGLARHSGIAATKRRNGSNMSKTSPALP
ncbi:Uncharacterised protein [Mycobacterium tuberculosis]|nr:Uncharacterised protein [Mycobacterium tuberculosis]COW44754.1 Uncharacterised protein [Mycobacterium tuberculosis]